MSLKENLFLGAVKRDDGVKAVGFGEGGEDDIEERRGRERGSGWEGGDGACRVWLGDEKRGD